MEYYTIDEVAKMLKVSAQTIRRLISNNELSCGKVGAQFRITQNDIDAYLKRDVGKPNNTKE